MRRHRRDQVKAAVLIATTLVVCTMPTWSLRTFVYVVGGLALVVGSIAAGMLLEIYVGFRRFERATGGEARRLFGKRESRRALAGGSERAVPLAESSRAGSDAGCGDGCGKRVSPVPPASSRRMVAAVRGWGK